MKKRSPNIQSENNSEILIVLYFKRIMVLLIKI